MKKILLLFWFIIGLSLFWCWNSMNTVDDINNENNSFMIESSTGEIEWWLFYCVWENWVNLMNLLIQAQEMWFSEEQQLLYLEQENSWNYKKCMDTKKRKTMYDKKNLYTETLDDDENAFCVWVMQAWKEQYNDNWNWYPIYHQCIEEWIFYKELNKGRERLTQENPNKTSITQNSTINLSNNNTLHCNIKWNISYTNGEKIYHMPWCSHYADTVINTEYGERWFCSEQEARDAWWRKCKEY